MGETAGHTSTINTVLSLVYFTIVAMHRQREQSGFGIRYEEKTTTTKQENITDISNLISVSALIRINVNTILLQQGKFSVFDISEVIIQTHHSDKQMKSLLADANL